MTMKRKFKENLWGYALILLPVIGTLFFYYYPITFSLFNSLFKWNVIQPREFIGFKNYLWIFFEDERIIKSFIATGQYLLFHIPLVVGTGLLFATILNNEKLKARNLFRTIIIIPWVTSPVAVGVVWLFIFNQDVGLINSTLNEIFGIEKIRWFTEPNMAMSMLLIVSVWRGMGYSFIFFLAGLQTIPVQLYEAAAIDGASSCQRFYKITLPMISPYIFMVTLLVLIGASQEFSLPLVLTDGRPDYATQLINLAIYKEAFLYSKMGYASAVATLAFIFVISFTAVQMILQKKWVFYNDK